MPEYQVLRVFLGPRDGGGNLLGVFLEGRLVVVEERQAIAAALGYSETVFVDDTARGMVEIYTPGTQLLFAGHPLVGTAWLLQERGVAPSELRPAAGKVPIWRTDDCAWIRARPEWAPPFEQRQLDDPGAVDEFSDLSSDSLVEVWAWKDEAAGTVRARVFPRAYGIDEDEATGSAAILLASKLGRPIEIHQGRGSVIVARPNPDGTVDVGGRVGLVDVRAYA